MTVITLVVSLEQLPGEPWPECKPVRRTVTRRLDMGQSLRMRGIIGVARGANADHISSRALSFGGRIFTPNATFKLHAVNGPLLLDIAPSTSSAALLRRWRQS